MADLSEADVRAMRERAKAHRGLFTHEELQICDSWLALHAENAELEIDAAENRGTISNLNRQLEDATTDRDTFKLSVVDGLKDFERVCRERDDLRRRLDKDTQLGLYNKFRVERTDGRSEPGQKHYQCRYFVLDITHDKFAEAAIIAYANKCAVEFPQLARDLRAALAQEMMKRVG